MEKERKSQELFGNRMRRYFISGIVTFLPLALTIYLFVLTINLADGILGRYIEPYFAKEFGFYVRGLSIPILIFLIFLIGFFTSNFLGRRIYPAFEGLLLRLPFFKQVYPAFREVAAFLFSQDKKMKFERVVLVQYPRLGVYSIGFLTTNTAKKLSEKTSQELCNVFMPHTPSPMGGFLILVPKKDLIFPDITVEEAIRIVVSAGVAYKE